MITCTVCGCKLADSDKGRAFHMKRYHGISNVSAVEKPIDPRPLTKEQKAANIARLEAKIASAIIPPQDLQKKPSMSQEDVLQRFIQTLEQLDKSIMRLNDTIMTKKRYD